MTRNFSDNTVTDAQGRGFLANMMEGEGNQTPQFVNQIVSFVPQGVRNHIFARNSHVDKCSRRKKETWASRALQSLHFEAARMLCSVLDLILLSWNIHDAALYAEQNPHLIGSGVRDLPMFVIFNDAFALLYVGEVLLRLWIERLHFFRIAHPWRTYNFIMSIIFACQAITQHVAFNERGHSQARIWLTNLAMFRIFRLFQIIGQETEYLRYSNTFKELRCMVYSLGGAMWSLLWSSIIVFSLLLMFALFFAEACINYRVQHHTAFLGGSSPLSENFGTLKRTLLSLFKSMTGGDDWGNVYESLEPLPSLYRSLFLGFIAFSVIALLNVVTAVFVESTMQRSQNDRELMTQNEIQAKSEFLKKMQSVFEELDEDDDGEINLTELQDRMKDRRIGAYFGSLGVDVVQVGRLFSLLDTDSSGSIDKEEFMFGCLRLKGEAKSLDVAVLHAEMRWVRQNLSELGDMIGDLQEIILEGSDSGDEDCETVHGFEEDEHVIQSPTNDHKIEEANTVEDLS